MSKIIGIDLGTTNSCVAVMEGGKPTVIANAEGARTTPSVVAFTKTGERLVGEPAKRQAVTNAEKTIASIKRDMGTDNGRSIDGKKYSPQQISAMILQKLKADAESYLGEKVSEAVITVPAYFNDAQRQATKDAGKIAGLDVKRIINEPTAAALSYGLEHMEEESHVLVYDLGGGTFDVTLLEMFDGVLEVKASNGDNQLGGKDFDEKLMQWLNERFKKKHGVDLMQDRYAAVKLKEEAERCKKLLSTQETCHILVPVIAEKGGRPLALDEEITAEQFEEIVRELLERTHRPIDVVLADSDILPEEIDSVILVGGSTRMPVVVKDIQAYLHIVPVRAVNPDYAVAEGAAIQAGMIQGSIRPEDGIVMTDVNPYTLGIRAMDDMTDDRMSVVIPRNVTIPVTRSQIYSTSWSGQTDAHIEVYQGESGLASSNHFLGDFVVSGIPAARAGSEKIGVQFSYNMNGMLDVKASILSTGKEASIEINMLEEKALQEEGIDVSRWKESTLARQFRTVIRRGEKALESSQIQDEPFMQEEIEDGLHYLKEALVKEDQEAALEAEEHLLKLLLELD